MAAPMHPSAEARGEELEKLRSMSPEERRAYRNQRYQELRERAASVGMELPERPPWETRGRGPGARFLSDEERAAHREKMRQMSPEEPEGDRQEQ